MEEDQEILDDFIQEAGEHLEGIEGDFLELEKLGASINKDLVNKCFRAMHSIKGAAGFLELKVIEMLAHRMETLLSQIGKGEIVPSSQVMTPLLKGTDRLSQLISNVAGSNQEDVSRELVELDHILSGVLPVEQAPTPVPAAEVVAPEPVEAEPTPVEAELDEGDQDEEEAPQQKQAKVADEQKEQSSLRVSVKTLNDLMNLAGELVLTRNQLLESLRSSDLNKIKTAVQNVDVITSDLQYSIMSTRMQPVGRVFNRFTRVVRDLARILNKKVRLDIEGQEVELDKTIIESIADPLTHLIRNAVDHGIETPEERRKAGKPEQGLVNLRAFHKAGHVIVEVSDDGKGMSPAKIRQKAISVGLMDRALIERMDDAEVLRLIFLPGFTTKEQVTEVSGRGVGMDVVNTNFTKLGGVLDIESKEGEGSLIRIKLPLTLAIIPSLIVSCGGDEFAIPQANLAELVSLSGDEVKQQMKSVAGTSFLAFRDGLLPLLRLDQVLTIPTPE